jgi:hypothetical protein
VGLRALRRKRRKRNGILSSADRQSISTVPFVWPVFRGRREETIVQVIARLCARLWSGALQFTTCACRRDRGERRFKPSGQHCVRHHAAARPGGWRKRRRMGSSSMQRTCNICRGRASGSALVRHGGQARAKRPQGSKSAQKHRPETPFDSVSRLTGASSDPPEPPACRPSSALAAALAL